MKQVNRFIAHSVRSGPYGAWHTGARVHYKIHQAMSDNVRWEQTRKMGGTLMNRIGRSSKQQLRNDIIRN